MLKSQIQNLLNFVGLSLHRKSGIDRLRAELVRLQELVDRSVRASSAPVDPNAPPGGTSHDDEIARLRAELRKHEERQIFYLTTEDYFAHDKMKRIVDRIPRFGEADFAELSCWLFAASLINHRVIHQRIDEGSLLWRAVKMSGGPILEVGRAAGGSTLVLLGASGARPVVSIDRGPFHAFIADHVFRRPDVASRLKLYVQTSRAPIAENEFGMIFIDADHSYEGVCHDIATFWNQLKPFDGKPALAAFHDAADNPITYVEPVKRACEEMLAERGAAKVVESWGSMLVLEKTGDIDQDRWFRKEHTAFWEQFAAPDAPVLRPVIIDGRLHAERPIPRLASANLLGDDNVDHESWRKNGLIVERLQLNEDNPLRLLREAPQHCEHGVERSASLNSARFAFSVFLRPHRLETIRLSVLADDRLPVAQADFRLCGRSAIRGSRATGGAEIIDAGFQYRNGYFRCSLAVAVPEPMRSATFAVNALDAEGGRPVYPGDGKRGFFMNLASVSAIL